MKKKKKKNLKKKKKFKISAPTWNAKLELPDDSYAVSNIQGNFENLKKNIENYQSFNKNMCK